MNLKLNASADKELTINILDQNGNIVCTKNICVKKGYNEVRASDIDCNLSPGTYVIIYNDASNTTAGSRKLIVK